MGFTSKVFLRRAERDDLDVVVAWMEDPDFTMFLYGDPAHSPKQIREKIAAMLGRTQGNTMPAAVYLIIESKEHGPIGLLSLQNISWRNRACAIDLYIGIKKLRGSLVAAFATLRGMEYCFDELNLHRVSAFIYAFNTASWRLIERVGAKRELTLNGHVARNGELHDVYGYGLLRSEFEAFRDKYPEKLRKLMDSMSKAERTETPQ